MGSGNGSQEDEEAERRLPVGADDSSGPDAGAQRGLAQLAVAQALDALGSVPEAERPLLELSCANVACELEWDLLADFPRSRARPGDGGSQGLGLEGPVAAASGPGRGVGEGFGAAGALRPGEERRAVIIGEPRA